jgi:antitoxin StbD
MRKRVLDAELYKMYYWCMTATTLSNFRAHQSKVLDDAQREPVEILSRGRRRRAVVVSPEFFDRALEALEDAEDTRAAAVARGEQGSVSHEELVAELGL